MFFRVLLIFFLTIFTQHSINAETPVFRNALWNEIYFLGRINTKWSWQMERHYRRISNSNSANLVSMPYQHLYRPWIHYEPYRWLRLSVSPFMYAITYSKNGQNTIFEPELRFSIQAMFIYRYFQRLIIHHRFRYEYRMIGDRVMHSSDEFDYNVEYNFPQQTDQVHYSGLAVHRERARYMLRFILPISKANTIETNSFYLIGWSELYVNVLPDIPSREIFDQNRTFLLLGYRLPSEYPIRLELGYGLRTANRFQYQTVEKYTHTTDLMNIIQFYLWVDNVHLFFQKQAKKVSKE
ncbi:MAG: DUF2490 domain-containing protein [Bacteroidota bacterium]|nr:DUF2490 domain-containing protein [Bacteroidota bacterium]